MLTVAVIVVVNVALIDGESVAEVLALPVSLAVEDKVSDGLT